MKVRYGAKVIEFPLLKGESITLNGDLKETGSWNGGDINYMVDYLYSGINTIKCTEFWEAVLPKLKEMPSKHFTPKGFRAENFKFIIDIDKKINKKIKEDM